AAGNALVIRAESLLSADNLRRLLVEMPRTFTGFHPLGYVLVVMLGAGVAERSGLLGTAMSAAVSNVPRLLLTPAVALVGMLGNLAADAAYVVLIPLAGVIFHAAGRHPVAGIAAAFAGVSGGFSANLLPGQLDALLFGITEAAAETILPTWDANIAGNAWFIVAMTLVFLPIIWYITDRVIEPRMGPYGGGGLQGGTAGSVEDAATGTGDSTSFDTGGGDIGHPEAGSGDPENLEGSGVGTEGPGAGVADAERRGLKRAGWAVLGVVALWVFLCIGPGTPLIDESAPVESRFNPLFQSLVAGFCVVFLAAGWAYGAAAGTVKNHRDLVDMMKGAMGDMAYYLVLSFAAAHFVAMFNWSNLGLIFAIQGAAVLESSNMPDTLLMASIILFGAVLNLFIGSASAKWALLAPVLVPMLMLVGISPEMTTAAYRVGDSATNIITPLMPYLPLVLVFAQRWQKDFGLGSLVATMLPYSMFLLLSGLVLTILWVFLGLPLGPAAPVSFSMP
ncbi:MAG: AbgT family transporter, partial [Rhodospirillaceae bacterium]|nr:AbgT family transporter [Rhodospirillaceae bacterium]